MSVIIDFKEQNLDTIVARTRELINLQKQLANTARSSAQSGATKAYQDQAAAATQATSKLKAYTDANLKLSNTLKAPVSAIRDLNKEFGKLPGTIQPIAQRFKELERAGVDTAESYRVLSREFGVTQKQFQALQNVSGQNNRLAQAAKEAAAETRKIATEMKAAAKEAERLAGQQVNAVARELAAASREADKLSASLRGDRVNVPDEEIARVSARLREAQAAAARLNQDFSLTSTQAQKLAAGVERAENATKDLGNAAANVGKRFDELINAVGAAGAAAAAGVAGILKIGGDAFLSFEQSSKTFGVLAEAGGATADQIARVNDEAARLGATTPKTAAEVSRLSVELSRAGFSAQDTEAALEGIVNGSIAAEEDLTRVGEIVGAALNQFQATGAEAQQFVDVLVVGANNSATSVDALGEALAYVGGTANAANQNIEDTTLALGLLANAGINGSRAGTNLGQVFQRLEIAANESAQGIETKASKAFQQLGVDVLDAEGKLRPFGELLPELQAGFNSLDQGDRAILQKNLFGQQGGRAFLALMQASGEDVARLREEIENAGGTSARVGEQLQKGLTGALASFSSALEAATSTIFSAFAPAAEALVRAATGLLSIFNSLPAPIQATLSAITGFVGVLGAAAAAYALFVAAQGPAVIAQGQLLAATLANNAAKLQEIVVTRGAAAAKTIEQIANARLTASQIASQVATIAANSAKAAGIAITKAAALAQQAFAVATGKASLASLGLSASVLSAGVAMGAFVAAVAAVAVAVDTFRSADAAAARTRDNLQEFEDQLIEIRKNRLGADDLVDEEAANNAKKLQDDLGFVQRGLDVVRQKVDEFLQVLASGYEAVGLDRIAQFFENYGTQAETASNRATVAFAEVQQKISDTAESGALETLFAIKEAPGSIPPEQIQANIDEVNAALETLQQETPVTPEAVASRNAQIDRLENLREKLQGAAEAQDELNETQGEFNEETLKSLNEGLQSDLADIELRGAQERARIAESGATEEAGAEARLAAEQQVLEDKLAANRQYLEQLKKLEALDPGNEAVAKQITEVETELANTRTAIAENGAEQAEAAEDARVKALEEALKESERLVEANATKREASVLQLEQSLRAAGVAEVEIAEQTTQARLDAERAGIEDQIALQKKRIAEYGAGTEEAKDAELELAALQNDLIQNQIDQEKALREAQVRAIEEAAAAERRTAQEAIAGIEARLAAQKAIEESLARQRELLQGQVDLANAASELRAAVADREEAQLGLALTARQQLAEIEAKQAEGSKLSAEEQFALTQQKAVLEERLRRAGLSAAATEEEIQRRIIEQAAARFQQEQQALAQQQEFERLSLEFEIQKDRISAQRAVREAELGARQLELQRQILEAELAAARVRGDQQAVLEAESQLAILGLQQEAAQETLRFAQENLSLEEQAAQQKRDQLAITQEQARLTQARAQEEEAIALTDAALTTGDAQAINAARELEASTAEQAAAAQDASLALANQVDTAASLRGEFDTLISQATTLADEAERFGSALAAGGTGQANVRSLRKGGAFEAGEPLQLHRDEFVVPSTAGYVISQAQSRRMVRDMLTTQPGVAQRYTLSPVAAPVPSVGMLSGGGNEELLSELRGLRADLRRQKRGSATVYQQVANKITYNDRQLESAIERALAKGYRQLTDYL